MHRSFECSTTPSSVEKIQFTGQTDAQGASVQCMQAIDTERSPGLPSLIVTTRRRLMPHGTSSSFLQAVTQRCTRYSGRRRRETSSAPCRVSSRRPDLAERGFGFLHAGHRVVAVVVSVFTLSPSTYGSAPFGYLLRWSTPSNH